MKETLSYRQLQSLIHVSNVLNSSLDVDTIIDSIMQVTIPVIDAADGGVLFLYDPEQDYLIAKSTHGFDPIILEQVRLKPGESMTGMTFAKKQCMIFQNQEEVHKKTSSLTKTNLRLMEESIPCYPHSTICAPILIKEDCIGVITIDSFNEGREFSQEDIKLLKAISHQAAVAIEKARLYREKEQTVRKLQELNHLTTSQNKLLSRSVEIHHELADLVLRQKGLDDILQYIHKKINHHVFLFNNVGELTASAYQSLPDHSVSKMNNIVLSHLQSAHSARSEQRIEIAGKKHHFIMLPIGSQPDLLGILAILAIHPLNEVDLTGLEHASTVISLELVKEQAIFDTQQRLNSAFIDDLFTGRADEALIRQAKHLQLDPKRKYMVAIIQMDHTKQKVIETELGVKRYLVRLANQIFIKEYPLGLIVTKHAQIVIILSFPAEGSVTYHQMQVSKLVNLYLAEIERKNLGFEFSAGIGRTKDGLEYVYNAATEAQKCLHFIKSYSLKDRVISYSDLGVQRLLLQNTEEELIEFVLEILDPLLKYENHRKGDLLQTLFLFLENGQNAKETGKSLHIHTNTLNYRLKRIKEILSIDFSNSDEFLDLYLAVRLYHYLEDKINFPAV